MNHTWIAWDIYLYIYIRINKQISFCTKLRWHGRWKQHGKTICSLKSLSSSCMGYQGQGYNLVFPWSLKWIREFSAKGWVWDWKAAICIVYPPKTVKRKVSIWSWMYNKWLGDDMCDTYLSIELRWSWTTRPGRKSTGMWRGVQPWCYDQTHLRTFKHHTNAAVVHVGVS